jgi:hypothetical protein
MPVALMPMTPQNARNSNARGGAVPLVAAIHPEPEERWLRPVRDLPFYSPKKIANWSKYLLLQGVSRDVVTQKSKVNSPYDLCPR